MTRHMTGAGRVSVTLGPGAYAHLVVSVTPGETVPTGSVVPVLLAVRSAGAGGAHIVTREPSPTQDRRQSSPRHAAPAAGRGRGTSSARPHNPRAAGAEPQLQQASMANRRGAGEMEDCVSERNSGMGGDLTSPHRLLALQLRVLLHAAALCMLTRSPSRLQGAGLQDRRVRTLQRLRLRYQPAASATVSGCLGQRPARVASSLSAACWSPSLRWVITAQ